MVLSSCGAEVSSSLRSVWLGGKAQNPGSPHSPTRMVRSSQSTHAWPLGTTDKSDIGLLLDFVQIPSTQKSTSHINQLSSSWPSASIVFFCYSSPCPLFNTFWASRSTLTPSVTSDTHPVPGLRGGDRLGLKATGYTFRVCLLPLPWKALSKGN